MLGLWGTVPPLPSLAITSGLDTPAPLSTRRQHHGFTTLSRVNLTVTKENGIIKKKQQLPIFMSWFRIHVKNWFQTPSCNSSHLHLSLIDRHWATFFLPLFCRSCLVSFRENLKKSLDLDHRWRATKAEPETKITNRQNSRNRDKCVEVAEGVWLHLLTETLESPVQSHHHVAERKLS